MKRLFKLFSIALILVLSGCSCFTKPIEMEESMYNNQTEEVFVDLTTFEEYQKLRDDKKSFAIYVYEESCYGCIKFSPILIEYLKSENLKIYRIDVSIAKSKDSPIKKEMEGTPAVFIFSEGEYITFLDSHNKKHTEAFKTPTAFGEWFTKYVVLK